MAAADEDSETQVPMEGAEEVPPPPPVPDGGRGPSARRARVQLPPPDQDDGPTYVRLGIDYPIQATDTEIHIQCARIKKLENLETAGASLKTLILVAGAVEKVENLGANVNLEHLELYQNCLKRIENIGHLSKLTNLDFSFNKIRSCEALGACQFDNLEKLYLSSNKISDIEGVFHFKNLKMLEFGSNRIRVVPPELASLTNLEQLWLGKNKIISMALPPLPSLRHLSMQSNRLEAWDASLFQNASGLTHLYLGHNNLPDLPDELALLTDLREFDLAGNQITLIRPFPQLTKLEELWLNDNKVAELSEVRHLASFPALQTIYLERNPMHGLGNPEMETAYKDEILRAVPNLFQLDAVRLGNKVEVITDGSEKNVLGIRKR